MPVPAFLHPFARPASERFTTIVRGEGAAVFDAAGRRYVDALASLWFCQIGHGRQEVADAVRRQMADLAAFHAFELFTSPVADALCERLVALAPMPGARVMLTTSGSEAVDSALKLARLAHHLNGEPDRTLVVARDRAYHGVTYGGMSLQGLPLNQAGFGPLVGDIAHVPHDDLDAIRKVVCDHPERLAAVVAEPVIGAGGVIPPAPGYLDGLRQLCDETGAFLVLDEVICGFGRLGAWWGATRFGVEPDLVTFAKGVTSGYQPLGGVLVGPAVREPLESDPDLLLRHGHTYSGHPAACAAALANLDVLEGEALAERADPIGEHLRAGFEALVADGRLAGVRGQGAMAAALLPAGVPAGGVRDRMLEAGVIARPIGDDVIAFCPPLVITDDDLDRCVESLASSLP